MRQMIDLIIKHMKDQYGWVADATEIRSNPHKEIVGWYFDALVYYRMKGHYFSLEDAEIPEEGDSIFIRRKGGRDMYRWNGATWEFFQSVEDEIYKA